MTKAGVFSPRTLAVAAVFGAIAGAVAGLTYMLMTTLQGLLWSGSEPRWYIFAVVLAGGGLLALIYRLTDLPGLQELIDAAGDVRALRWKKVAILAVAAIIAVAFGGSIGPEAGLVAVAGELAILVNMRILRSEQDARALGGYAGAAALAGVYGSPPAGAAYADDSLTVSKLPKLLAGVAGFIGFVLTLRMFGHHSHALELPLAPRGDLSSWLYAVPAALVAALVSVGYLALHHFLRPQLAKVGPAWVQALVGSALLAGLLAAWPLLMFSGHRELEDVAALAAAGSWGALVALALLKALATSLSLSAGWRGGEFFPLALVGAAAGTALMGVLPGLDAGTALVAGLTAGATVAVRKPVAVLLIVVLMVEGTAIGPVVIASAIAMLVGGASPFKPHNAH